MPDRSTTDRSSPESPVGTCETCVHWDPLVFEDPDATKDPRYRGGIPEVSQMSQWGACRKVGEGAGTYRKDFDEEKSVRAFTRDASDYHSWLTTRSDFGCIEHAVTIGDAGASSVPTEQVGQDFDNQEPQ